MLPLGSDLKSSAKSKALALKNFIESQTQRWTKGSRDIPPRSHFVFHTKTLLYWGFHTECSSKEEQRGVLSGHYWQESLMLPCRLFINKKKEKKKPPTHPEWMENEIIVGKQPLAMSSSDRFRLSGSHPIYTKPFRQWTQARLCEQPNLPIILHQESTACVGTT